MTSEDFLFRSDHGLNWYLSEEDGEVKIAASSDCSALLEQNRAKQVAGDDGWSEDKTFRRVAEIPAIVMVKWLNEEGWWALDPACADKLKQKMNDPDWRYLRTAEWTM